MCLTGLNINEDRGNAVALLAQLLEALLSKHPEIRATDLCGGDKRNAIAREAQATVLVCCSIRMCSLYSCPI